MGRQGPPSEEEQVAAYGEVFRAFGPHRPVVVRLADIGGDKDIPYLRLPRKRTRSSASAGFGSATGTRVST